MTTTDTAGAPSTTAPRLLAAWHLTGRADLASHLSVHGALPSPHRGDGGFARRLLEDIRSAGLTGRGGAGFPSARKWDSLARERHGLLVVNAMDSEPAGDKDRALLSGAPHLVLDGAELAAFAIGAREVVVCVADDQPRSLRSLQAALAERGAAGIDLVPTEVVQPPGRYVAGEESALVSWVGGGDARPVFRPEKGTPLRVKRRATLVHNAETLAHVALIARHGPAWFRAVGLPDAPGTTLVRVSGAVERQGVYEVALGTPVRSILEDAGVALPLTGVLVGGYGGTWLSPGALDTAYAPRALAAVGGAVGAGVLGALPATSCGVAETARVALYMAGESAGQCGPCVFGLPAIAGDLADLARGEGGRSTLARLRHRLDEVAGRGACGHPDGVVRLVRSALGVFASDVAAHAKHQPCPHWNRRPVLPVPRAADDAVRRAPAARHGRATRLGAWRE